MLSESEIVCIFESPLPIKELSKQHNVNTDLIISIQIGLYGNKFTEGLIPGLLQRRVKRTMHEARLDEEEVEFIIKSTRTYRELAALFFVSKDTIADAKTGRTWKHLDRSKKQSSKRRYLYGEQCNASKLTNEQAKEIISLLGTMSNKDIAAKFNVTLSLISLIRRNELWCHIPRTSVYINRRNQAGIKHHNSKITKTVLNEILENKEPLRKIAKKFNLSPSTVFRARRKYLNRTSQCYNSLRNANS